MFKVFKESFKLQNTYKTNSKIYQLKQIFLIKKMLPSTLYANKTLKKIMGIISIITEICSIFFGKIFYLLLLIYLPSAYLSGNTSTNFLNIFFFLTISGALCNTNIFNPTKDRYYAMFLLRMDANKYTLVNYYYYQFKLFLGFTSISFIFCRLMDINVSISLIMALFVISCKNIVICYDLLKYTKTGNVTNENAPHKLRWVAIIIPLVLAYGLPIINFSISYNLFIVISLITILLGIVPFIYIIKFKQYRSVYKLLLNPNDMSKNTQDLVSDINKTTSLKAINNSVNITSNKVGYEYFNDIFIKRHSNLLMKQVNRACIFFIVVIGIIIAITIFFPLLNPDINSAIHSNSPIFIIIIYYANRSRYIISAMFMNCDHSMLSYRFYRNHDVIFKLFIVRFKSIVKIELKSTLILALGIVLLLFLSGSTTNLVNYLLLFVTLLTISIMFTLHSLVLYYLFQPYNKNLQMKSYIFIILDIVTFFILYQIAFESASILYFSTCVLSFSLVYSVVAICLVKKLAPKTFKIRN